MNVELVHIIALYFSAVSCCAGRYLCMGKHASDQGGSVLVLTML